MQTQSRRLEGADVETVQGVLELGLRKVLHSPQAVISISSRTDNGVHAVQAAAHFDHDAGKTNT